MSNSYDPLRSSWTPGRRSTVTDGELRVSDAERRQVADALAEHYAEGRLDESELNERLGAAMGAKTRNDLAPLLSDLPRRGAPEPPPRPRPRRAAHLFVLMVTLLFVMSLTTTFFQLHVPWVLIGLFVFVFGRRHHRHGHWLADSTPVRTSRWPGFHL